MHRGLGRHYPRKYTLLAMKISNAPCRIKGFTLIELMITVAIAAVLLLVAIPSLNSFQRNAELTSIANKVIGSISAARGEAMKRGMNAVVVPLDNGSSWSAGWAAFVDKANNQTYDSSATGIVAIQEAIPSGITVVGNGTAGESAPYIMFDASGFSRTKSSGFGALTLKIQRTDVATDDQPGQTRIVIVSSTGRVRVCKPASATDANCKDTLTQ